MERCYQTAGGCTLGLRFGTLEIPWPPWAPTCLLRQCSANSWWVPKVFVRITRSNTYTCEITVHYYKTYMWGFHLLMWQGQGKYRTGCGDWEQWIRSFSCFTCKVPTSALHIVKQRRHLDSKGDVLPGHIKSHLRYLSPEDGHGKASNTKQHTSLHLKSYGPLCSNRPS